MKPTKIVSLLLVFSPLLCFAETTGTTNEVPAIETEANLETSTDENLIEEIETNTTELNDNSLIIEDTKTEKTSNSDISSEPKSDIDVTTKVEQKIRNDNNKNDSIISDLQSYYKLQEKYDSLRKELTIDKETKRVEIQNREQVAISEIENYTIWIWLGVFVLTVILEASTQDFVSIWFAVGALVAIAISYSAPFWVELIVFVVISAMALIFTRPLVKKLMDRTVRKTNSDEFVGKRGGGYTWQSVRYFISVTVVPVMQESI